jgi:3-dehydroquinate synthase
LIVQSVAVPVVPRPYEVLIEGGLLQSVGRHLTERVSPSAKYFIITVPPVRKHWGEALGESLTAAQLQHHGLEMPDGEKAKTVSVVEYLAGKLVKRGADRRSVIVAFGGGVVGDTAAFLASIYMRGIDVVQIPTTLLAQIDSSIGGKTGVNLHGGKNLLGTFHQPRVVLVDPALLTTLPEREYRAGLYEAMKCGVIRKQEIFDFMEQQREAILRRDTAALEWLITECVKVKAEVVAADEREAGLRRILNFGHTIGHALEAETGYTQFLHGEAVAWGMIAASMISVAIQKADADTARRIISAVLAYAALPKVAARGKSIVKRLSADKKTLDGVPHFVLPIEIGRVEVVNDVPERAIVQAVEELRYLSQV